MHHTNIFIKPVIFITDFIKRRAVSYLYLHCLTFSYEGVFYLYYLYFCLLFLFYLLFILRRPEWVFQMYLFASESY